MPRWLSGQSLTNHGDTGTPRGVEKSAFVPAVRNPPPAYSAPFRRLLVRPPLLWLSNWRTQAQVKRFQALLERWQELKNREKKLSPCERCDLGQLKWEIETHPADPNDFLPTRLGNLLRSAELLPKERFELDAVTCWLYLWLLMLEEALRELLNSQSALDRSVQSVVWGFLFFLWTLVSPWALLIVALWLILAYRRLYCSAAVFADLQMAAFSLYRWELHHSQRWALPQGSESEVAHGKRLSESLGRGTSESVVQYQ